MMNRTTTTKVLLVGLLVGVIGLDNAAGLPSTCLMPFTCPDGSAVIAARVDTEDACEEACRTCEGSKWFCPVLLLSEHDEPEGEEEDMTILAPQASSVASRSSMDNSSVMEWWGNSTNSTNSTYNDTETEAPELTLAPTERNKTYHYQCQCFRVEADTTGCTYSGEPRIVCSDPDFNLTESFDSDLLDSGAVGFFGTTRFFLVSLAISMTGLFGV